MCICEMKSAPSHGKNGGSIPSTKTVTANRRAPLAAKKTRATTTKNQTQSMAPPPSPSVTRAPVVVVTKAQAPTVKQQPQQSELSLQQLSGILDPFFDTCSRRAIAIRHRRDARRQDAALAVSTATSGTKEAKATITSPPCLRLSSAKVVPAAAVQRCFLSQTSEPLRSVIPTDNQQGCPAPVSCGCALRDFMSMDKTAWMDMVQDMEAEKNAQLGLEVRAAC